MSHTMTRDDESKIKQAFLVILLYLSFWFHQAIDKDRKGYIEPEKMRQLLMTMGEPFTKEEVDEMFAAAIDPAKGVIVYQDYASLLANDWGLLLVI